MEVNRMLNVNQYEIRLDVQFKPLMNKVVSPTYSTIGSGACDIRVYPEMDCSDPNSPDAPTTHIINPGEIYKAPTGFATAFASSFVALVFNRSGMVTNRKLSLPAGVYVIDSDYRGQWMIPIQNLSSEPQILQSGDRIAQIIFLPRMFATFTPVENLPESTRGNGGFGSTGIK